MKYVCCLIVVEDIQKARNLYEKLLGQKVINDFGENVGFEGGFAIHKREHFERLINGRKVVPGSNTSELYFEDDDIEKVEKALIEEGLTFIHPIKEQPWRQRVMRFYDYDKNIIEIGERMEYTIHRLHKDGLNTEEIMKCTYMPKEVIESAIREYNKSQKDLTIASAMIPRTETQSASLSP